MTSNIARRNFRNQAGDHNGRMTQNPGRVLMMANPARLIWRTSSCAQADADADGRPGLPAPRAITSGAGASIRLG